MVGRRESRIERTEANPRAWVHFGLPRLGQVKFKLCVSTPAELDGVLSAQLWELVAHLFAQLGELVRANADLCAEIAHGLVAIMPGPARSATVVKRQWGS
jgi:hypothetical protein